jgi:hypothetical protein
MNDYAAAPVQPIAQGLVTVGPGPNFTTTFFEIIVWRGDAGVEPANVNIVGGVPPVIQL